jgi:hypothetical protein
MTLFGLGIAAVVLTAACRKASVVALPEALRQPPRAAALAPSARVRVDLYLDASQSMRGFLAAPQGKQQNHFADLLRKGTDILRGSWEVDEVHPWRFGVGEPVDLVRQPGAPIGARDFLSRPALFSDLESHLDAAARHRGSPVNEPSRAKVKVMVTDLFQTDADVGRLAEALNSTYLTRDTEAVGVMGIRNPFSGPITDLPGKLPAGAADSLPFYVLVAGPVADVRLAMGRLGQRLPRQGSFPADGSFTVLFTRRLVPAVEQRLELLQDKDPSPGYTPDRRIVPAAEGLGIPQVRLSHQGKVTLRVRPAADAGQNAPAKAATAVLPGPAVTNSLGLVARPSAQVRKVVTVWSASRKGTADPAAAAAFELDAASGEIAIDGPRLQRSATYLLQLDVVAEPGDFAALEAWTLDDSAEVMRGGAFAKAKDGSRPGRTPNLRHFLLTLSDRMFQSEIPLARYYLYARVN